MKFRASLLFIALLAAAVFAPAASAAGPSITLTTDPPADEVVPDLTMTRVTIAVVDDQGNQIPNVKIGFKLRAPASPFIFSSDFPVVEGTDLMSYELVAADGSLEFEYLWPIRGSYDVVLSASPTADSPVQFDPITENTTFRLGENPDELNNIIIFVVILGVFGLISGLILGRSLRVKQETE